MLPPLGRLATVFLEGLHVLHGLLVGHALPDLVRVLLVALLGPVGALAVVAAVRGAPGALLDSDALDTAVVMHAESAPTKGLHGSSPFLM